VYIHVVDVYAQVYLFGFLVSAHENKSVKYNSRIMYVINFTKI